MGKLAINGGEPTLEKPLSAFYPAPMGGEEEAAVLRVVKSQKLSDFVGAAGDKFLGGVEVKRLEKHFTEKFDVKHAVSFNSATTALHGAMVALGVGPGDEVIVPPYTMAATATCVLMNGAVPIFADITDTNFCIDPKSIKESITERTKAVIVVNIFGGPADYDEILKIAKEHNIAVVEDNAQGPGGHYKGKSLGTVADIGVFSLNIHKAINAGEGGVLVTNNDKYALRAQLCRNHGEAVVAGMPEMQDEPIIGSNYRMSELHAAVAYEQMLKMDELNKHRVELADYLREKLEGIDGIIAPAVEKDSKHVYYVFPLKIDEAALGISRDKFVLAMEAEGFPMSKGYVKPIYLLPVFQHKKVFNETNFPFDSKYYDGNPDYSKGSCPTCERMHEKEFTFTTVCQHPYTKKEVDLFISAVKKVIENKDELV